MAQWKDLVFLPYLSLGPHLAGVFPINQQLSRTGCEKGR